MMKKFLQTVFLCLVLLAASGFETIWAQQLEDALDSDTLAQHDQQEATLLLSLLDGSLISWQELLTQDKISIIKFWDPWAATHCKPCQMDLAQAAERYQKWKAEGSVQLYAVSVGDTKLSHDFLAEQSLVNAFPVLLDEHGELQAHLGVQNVPCLFIFDRQGTLVYDGRTDQRPYEQVLSELLGASE